MVNGGSTMMKPNFDSMTRQELREYILLHREDDDAIEALINKGNPNSPTYKFPQTDEDLQEMAVILKQKLAAIENKI
jgi:succinate dehydrogenase flavin-adding protein (antitoxin of CptAB toxin-antitoxin module)